MNKTGRRLVSLAEMLRRPRFCGMQNLKRIYKRKKFEKYALIEKDLSLCARSDCVADKPGLIRIGRGCEIFGTIQSQGNGEIRIGDHTCIFERSIVGSVNRIQIGNCVIISNQVHIFDNNNHPVNPQAREQMCREGFHTDSWRWNRSRSAAIVIEDNVWIGENAVVLKGVTIGKGAIVACNAVVTRDVPAYTIVAGNPAQIVKEIEND